MTQHAAFRYLALDYGLKQVPISGLSPDSEPSAARLAELTKYIKKNNIKYIYFEENASQALASTLAKETGVKLDVLNPLESLTEKQTKDGADYISIMKSNLKALKKTTDQAGAEISAEKEKIQRLYKMATLKIVLLKTVRCLTMQVNGNPFIHICKMEL